MGSLAKNLAWQQRAGGKERSLNAPRHLLVVTLLRANLLAMFPYQHGSVNDRLEHLNHCRGVRALVELLYPVHQRAPVTNDLLGVQDHLQPRSGLG